MKTPVSVSLEKEQVDRIDSDRLSKDIGRSGIVRIALSEYYDRKEKTEKEEKIEKIKE